MLLTDLGRVLAKSHGQVLILSRLRFPVYGSHFDIASFPSGFQLNTGIRIIPSVYGYIIVCYFTNLSLICFMVSGAIL